MNNLSPFRDHFFDSKKRGDRNQRKSKYSNLAGPRSVTRGAQGVRSYHKRDESKVNALSRLGLDANDFQADNN